MNLTADASPLDDVTSDIEMQPMLPKVYDSSTKVPNLSSLDNKLDKLEQRMEYIDKKFSDMLNKITPMLKRIAAETNSSKPKH